MALGAQVDPASQQTLSLPSALAGHLHLAPLVSRHFPGFQVVQICPVLQDDPLDPLYLLSLLVQGTHVLLCPPGHHVVQLGPEAPIYESSQAKSSNCVLLVADIICMF